MYVKDWC